MQPLSISDLEAIQTKSAFKDAAFHTFEYQYENCDVYRAYCDLINQPTGTITKLENIPYLPISLFQNREIICGTQPTTTIFRSSGTTANQTSQHFVSDLNLYEWSFRTAFKYIYGAIEEYVVLALLPSYLERKDASLVYMVADMIEQSQQKESGFYLHDFEPLSIQLKELEARGQKTLLIGVSFALLDFATLYPQQLQHTLVMETGGMKGRKKEMIRAELHDILKSQLGTPFIHSEYGMTELLSQAYCNEIGLFIPPPWMQVFIRDTSDPFSLAPTGQTGGLNIMDLANQHSCAFLATQDLGKRYDTGYFEVLGRFDAAEIRGCNLMVGETS